MLKKLFGSKRPPEEIVDPDEEPARVAPPLALEPDLKKRTEARLKPKGGFDPYNSGTFQRENAWERVTRK